ncbi:hypothetical protein Salat_1887400 [Sesamum alatum]|uniref:Uncharacterized protein n=1 Tax=Sesamum alatum TaxID=300844 RepID=A0AAE2CI53_9LAMI|nr:hypothetical protein Salat_1887400 [Sesamum alatum]
MFKNFRARTFETDIFQLIDGHGREVRVYLDAVRDPKTAVEIEGEGEDEPVHNEGDKEPMHNEDEEEPVHRNKDKGKGVVIEERGDGEGVDCPPISQPEPEVSSRKKPIKRAIFNDEDEPLLLIRFL